MSHLYQSAFIINKKLKKLINTESINSFGKTFYQGDNANYCISLFHDNLIEPDDNTKQFLSQLGRRLIKWSNENLHKGYFKMEDVHHGSELFLGFLPRYIDLFPDDASAKELILSVAEYIGNWVDKTDSWYDYEKNNFKSWYFGSMGIHQNNLFRYNTADHLRLVHIALLAWQISGNIKYLNWSNDYSRVFAKKIIKSKGLVPVAWDNDWKEYFSLDMKSKEEKFLAANHHHLAGNQLSGIENLLASGVIYIFGYLYQVTKEKIYHEASKIILQKLLPILTNQYSDVVGINFNYFRFTFSDDSFDKSILKLVDQIPSIQDSELMLAFPEDQKVRLSGVGNRKDMIYWFYLNILEPRKYNEPSTAFFTLLYNLTGDLKYVERAFSIAARKIKITSSLLRSGYEHADSGKLFSSFVSGHGRNWGVGTITGCYSPIIIGSDENLGLYDYSFKFLSKTISSGCLPIVRKLVNGNVELALYNYSNTAVRINFIYKKNNQEMSVNIKANSAIKKFFD